MVAVYSALNQMPSLEPVRAAIAALVAADLLNHLGYVEALCEAKGLPAQVLSLPAVIRQESNTDLSQTSTWPALVILSSAARSISFKESSQSPGAGLYQGEVQLLHFAQHADPLTLITTLERTIAAYWAMLVANDPLPGGYRLQPETLMVDYSAPNQGTTSRGAGLSVGYTW